MPFAMAPDGVRIHYEVVGEGPALVLQHGLLSTIESWHRRGYVERLAPHLRLVLVDSRGHGESDEPEEQEAYQLRTRVIDITSVLNDLEIRRAHYLGFSMGCWIGYGALIYMPHRFKSLTLGGFSPLLPEALTFKDLMEMPAILQNPQYSHALTHHRQGMEYAMNELNRWGGAAQAIRTTEVPLLLFAGTEDPNDAARQMPEVAATAKDATFFGVEGADHAGSADAVDVVAPRVIEFVQRVEAASSS
jgi:pimeloyl-ACP methyl ester carboxylesterase